MDAERVSEALLNLLPNALDACAPSGAIQVRALQSRAHPGMVEFCVKDDGSGMPPEICTRVFEPFFTTKPVGKGSGLGLTLVRKIVAQHGGLVELESAPGQGTTVRMLLPAG